MEKFYITSPIYYVNDKPHIGHAYTGLACDVIARHQRLKGMDVHFLTGTDEHGQKVENSAALKNRNPQEFTDELSQKFKDLAKSLNLSNDDFVRTTEQRHKDGTQALWKALLDKGEIYLGEYEGWYAVRDEAFYGESELTKNAEGKFIAPSGAEVEWVSEPSYFFRLSEWGDKLLKFYEDNPDFIAPTARRNEVISFVKGGLKDLSVSRTSFSWGIKVPDDEDHIMYVWLDALANYISVLGYGYDDSKYKKYWPANLHIVGKDILRFHAVYWPAFLLAADLLPPVRIYAHGWWTNEGQKISKSLGNVIDPYDLINDYGLDQVRYFLMREIPFGNDGDFSRSAIIRRINSDLANDLGNLCMRILSFTHKNCDGKIPPATDLQQIDTDFLNACHGLKERLAEKMEKQAISDGLAVIWEVISAANVYVNDVAPWALRKTDESRMQTVLHTAILGIRDIAVSLQAFMPETSTKIFKQLGLSGQVILYDAAFQKADMAGTAIPAPEGLFPRITEAE